MRVALLDDYQGVALGMANWGSLPTNTEVKAFRDHLVDEAAIAERLRDFDVVVAMRERTRFPRTLLERLPNLRLLITTAGGNATFDLEALKERGVVVCGTRNLPYPTAELTWGLILALARHIPMEGRAIAEGRWQTTIGVGLQGKTLGLVGLGNLGGQVAAVGRAFGMELIAWSQNLTAARCAEYGATLVTKDEVFARADFVTVHLVLSQRTRGLIGARELALIRPTAFLVNTSRGPIVEEQALAAALGARRIAGAGVDVFDEEPLAPDHPFRRLDNIVLTPHVGYVTKEGYEVYYGDVLEDIQAFLAGKPIRLVQPRRTT